MTILRPAPSEKGDPMKCKMLALLLVLSLLLAGCSKPAGRGTFYFDPEKVVNGIEPDRNIPHSLSDLEQMTKYEFNSSELKPTAVIFQCVVSGPSINRLPPPPDERDPSVAYAAEHVLTPVTVTKILYAGEDVYLTVGKSYYVHESFHYVTEEDPDSLAYYDYGTAILHGYSPMQRYHTYLVFGKYEHNQAFNYQGQKVIGPVAFEGVLCVADEDTARAVTPTGNYYYWQIWKEAMAKYG